MGRTHGASFLKVYSRLFTPCNRPDAIFDGRPAIVRFSDFKSRVPSLVTLYHTLFYLILSFFGWCLSLVYLPFASFKMLSLRSLLCATIAALSAVDFADAAYLKPSDLDKYLLSSYDYLIVGGGPSGLTVANRLTEDPNGRFVI